MTFRPILIVGCLLVACGAHVEPPAVDAMTHATLEAADSTAEISARGAVLSFAHERATFALRALGRERLVEVGDAEVARDGETIELRRGPVTEWWRSMPNGLEHGVTIDARPQGEGALVLEIEVGGMHAERLSDDAVVLADQSGARIATYAQLVVLDADARRVSARMAAVDGSIRIEVDDEGARYPLVVDPIVATYETALVASVADDRLGGSVVVSGDGSVVVAGVPGEDLGGMQSVGGARVFVRSGTTWSSSTLMHPSPAAVDFCGYDVAITSDATRIVMGCASDDSPLSGAGSAHVFVRSGTTWTREATLLAPDPMTSASFGRGIALTATGDRVVIGANSRDGAAGLNSGGAYVFVRTGTVWAHEATLVSPEATAGSFDGDSVDIDSVGDRIVVSAPGASSGALTRTGAVWVYERSGTTWTFAGAARPAVPRAGSYFGGVLALSADGDTLLVGTPAGTTSADTRRATVLTRGSAAWSEVATLQVPGLLDTDELGSALALSDDGTRAVVGAHYDDAPLTDQGSVHLFSSTTGAWAYDGSLVIPDPAASDELGWSVAMAGDGSLAAAGAYLDDMPGAANAGSVRVWSLVATAPNGTACTDAHLCTSGSCVDGVCCDSACGGGVVDCQACAIARGGTIDGTCTALAPATAPTVTCRAAVDLCDAPEVCGASPTCPADALRTTGTTCRPSTGACDIAETCNGASAVCPGDMVQPLGTSCGGTMPGTCAGAGVCNGASTICPSATVRPMGAVCLPAVPGVPCDVDDVCDGVTSTCLARYAPATTACGSIATDVCDAPDHCSGTSADCVLAFLSGIECRASTGGCDPAEVCSGTAAACPLDLTSPAGTVCRASTALTCDPLESCDGVATACPAEVNTCADVGVGIDGGPMPTDSGPRSDAPSVVPDAGGAPPVVAGCACRAGVAASGVPRLALVVMLTLGLRRRRRSPRSR